MRPDDFINGLKLLDQYDMVSPYHSVLDLTPQESGLQLEEIVKIDRAGRGEEDHQKINICGGISMFRKQAIQKIGGWSEEFIGSKVFNIHRKQSKMLPFISLKRKSR